MKSSLKLIAVFFIMLPSVSIGQGNIVKKNDFDTISIQGKMVPEFSGVSISGNYWDNENIKGKVVLINFWAIGCAPCMSEIPFLNKLNNEFSNDDFILLSISPHVKEDLAPFVDTTLGGDYKTVLKFFNCGGIEYEVIPACLERKGNNRKVEVVDGDTIIRLLVSHDCDNILKDFKVDGVPKSFFVDKKGIIRYIKSGFIVNLPNMPRNSENLIIEEEYRKLIIGLLNEE